MPENNKKKTIILYSDDLGKVLVAFNMAMGAAAMGFEVTMFFTYWGLAVLRKEGSGGCGKNFLQGLTRALFPVGPSKLFFPRAHRMGLGTWLIKRTMRKSGVLLPPELIKSAQEMGVKFVGCQMCLDIFNLDRSELIDGVEWGGIATCMESVSHSDASLFI